MEHEVNFGKSKMSKKKRIIIFIICLIGIVIASYLGIKSYIQRYNEHISMAEYYYENGKYDLALNEAEQIFPVGENEDFINVLKLMKESHSFLPNEEDLKHFTSERPSEVLNELLVGLSFVNNNEKKFQSLNKTKEFKNIKNRYLSILNDNFGITETTANNIITMSSSKRIEKVNELSQIASDKKTKEFLENYVPEIEITEKHAKVDGDYIYVTGAVKNNTKSSLYYVKVKVEYLDDYKNVVDSDWTYVNSSDGLQPNAQKYFDMMTKINGTTKNYRVSIMDYDN